MTSIIHDIGRLFQRGDASRRLIFINVAVFLIVALAGVLLLLFKQSGAGLLHLLELPARPHALLWQPWSLLTYMFVHTDVLHLLFNMLCLHWFGRLFLEFFSPRQLVGLYILGGVGGGLFYMLAFNIFPFFEDKAAFAYLLGASASILAIVMATAYRTPDYRLQLFLLGNVRLKHLAIAALVADLLFITAENAGGHVAHIGGALTGLLFAQQLLKTGTDLTRWADRIAGLFRPQPHKPKLKVVRGKGKFHPEKRVETAGGGESNQKRIDRILDKIKQSGYQSLSEEEKRELFNAGKT